MSREIANPIAVDVNTVCEALGNTLGGDWAFNPHTFINGGFFMRADRERKVADPRDFRDGNDVCLEILWEFIRLGEYRIEAGPTGMWDILERQDGRWESNWVLAHRIPTSGQQFRDSVVRLCAGQEARYA